MLSKVGSMNVLITLFFLGYVIQKHVYSLIILLTFLFDLNAKTCDMCRLLVSAYPVQPDQLVGDGVGPHVALEVDIVARPQVVGVQALAQPQRHPRLVCKHRD